MFVYVQIKRQCTMQANFFKYAISKLNNVNVTLSVMSICHFFFNCTLQKITNSLLHIHIQITAAMAYKKYNEYLMHKLYLIDSSELINLIEINCVPCAPRRFIISFIILCDIYMFLQLYMKWYYFMLATLFKYYKTIDLNSSDWAKLLNKFMRRDIKILLKY